MARMHVSGSGLRRLLRWRIPLLGALLVVALGWATRALALHVLAGFSTYPVAWDAVRPCWGGFEVRGLRVAEAGQPAALSCERIRVLLGWPRQIARAGVASVVRSVEMEQPDLALTADAQGRIRVDALRPQARAAGQRIPWWFTGTVRVRQGRARLRFSAALASKSPGQIYPAPISPGQTSSAPRSPGDASTLGVQAPPNGMSLLRMDDVNLDMEMRPQGEVEVQAQGTPRPAGGGRAHELALQKGYPASVDAPKAAREGVQVRAWWPAEGDHVEVRLSAPQLEVARFWPSLATLPAVRKVATLRSLRLEEGLLGLRAWADLPTAAGAQVWKGNATLGLSRWRGTWSGLSFREVSADFSMTPDQLVVESASVRSGSDRAGLRGRVRWQGKPWLDLHGWTQLVRVTPWLARLKSAAAVPVALRGVVLRGSLHGDAHLFGHPDALYAAFRLRAPQWEFRLSENARPPVGLSGQGLQVQGAWSPGMLVLDRLQTRVGGGSLFLGGVLFGGTNPSVAMQIKTRGVGPEVLPPRLRAEVRAKGGARSDLDLVVTGSPSHPLVAGSGRVTGNPAKNLSLAEARARFVYGCDALFVHEAQALGALGRVGASSAFVDLRPGGRLVARCWGEAWEASMRGVRAQGAGLEALLVGRPTQLLARGDLRVARVQAAGQQLEQVHMQGVADARGIWLAYGRGRWQGQDLRFAGNLLLEGLTSWQATLEAPQFDLARAARALPGVPVSEVAASQVAASGAGATQGEEPSQAGTLKVHASGEGQRLRLQADWHTARAWLGVEAGGLYNRLGGALVCEGLNEARVRQVLPGWWHRELTLSPGKEGGSPTVTPSEVRPARLSGPGVEPPQEQSAGSGKRQPAGFRGAALLTWRPGGYSYSLVGRGATLAWRGLPLGEMGASGHWDRHELGLDRASLEVGGGFLTASGHLPRDRAGRWALDWKLRRVDLVQAARFCLLGLGDPTVREPLLDHVERGVEGRVNARGHLQGEAQHPQGQADLHIYQALLYGRPLTATLGLDLGKDRLRLSKALVKAGPDAVSLEGWVERQARSFLDLTARIEHLDVAALRALVPSWQAARGKLSEQPSGVLHGQVRFRGSLRHITSEGAVGIDRPAWRGLDADALTARWHSTPAGRTTLSGGLHRGVSTLQAEGVWAPVAESAHARQAPAKEKSLLGAAMPQGESHRQAYAGHLHVHTDSLHGADLPGAPGWLHPATGTLDAVIVGTLADPQAQVRWTVHHPGKVEAGQGALHAADSGRRTSQGGGFRFEGRLKANRSKVVVEALELVREGKGRAVANGRIEVAQGRSVSGFRELFQSLGAAEVEARFEQFCLDPWMELLSLSGGGTVEGSVQVHRSRPLRGIPQLSGRVDVKAQGLRGQGWSPGTLNLRADWPLGAKAAQSLDLESQGDLGHLRLHLVRGADAGLLGSVQASPLHVEALGRGLGSRVGLGGELDLSLEAGGSVDKPVVDGRFSSQALHLGPVQVADLTGTLRGREGIYEAHDVAGRVGGRPARLSATVPLRWRDGRLVCEDEVSLRAYVSDEGLSLLSLVLPQVRRPQGRLDAHVLVQGRLPDLHWLVDARLDEAGFCYGPVQTPLEHLSGRLTVVDRAVTLKGVKATLGGGPLELQGSARLQGWGLGELAVHAEGKNLRVDMDPYLSGEGDLSVSLLGSSTRPQLEGNIKVHHLQALLPASELRRLSLGGAEESPSLALVAASSDPASLGLAGLLWNLRIDLGNQSWFQCLNSRIRGDGVLDVRGQGTRPNLVGGINLRQGQLQLPTMLASMQLTSGTVRFVPQEGWIPRITAHASARVGDYDVFLDAAGSLANPRLSFTSSPPLSQVELQQLMVFGQAPSTATSGLEAPRVSSLAPLGYSSLMGVAQLSVLGPLTSVIRDALALSAVSFEVAPSGGVQIKVAKSLDEAARYFLTYTSTQLASANNLQRSVYGFEWHFGRNRLVRVSTDDQGVWSLYVQGRWRF